MGKKFIDRTGEIKYNNSGQKITIIKYRNSNDIDVQFEDGVIAYHRKYSCFKKGEIKYPTEYRIGETNINNQGEKITIIAHRKCDDIDVQFEDGVVVYHRTYRSFKLGEIKHPIRYEESIAHHIEIELGLNLDDIWNWDKNKYNPREITKQSSKKIWLYCFKHDYHNYNREGDKIGYETTCIKFYNSNCSCSYCGNFKTHWKDSLAYNYPKVAKMIAIKENNLTFEDCYNIAPFSSKKFYFKCNECENISSNKKTLGNIIKQGYSCEFCSDGLPTTEKFMANILKQLDIKFKTQLNKTDFDWCGYFKYDFYIPSLNMIIETHGEQHYIESKDWKSLEEEQWNDLFKYKCAKNHVDNYIVIDCRYSTLEWLKENIIKELGGYFDLSNINWELAWEESQNSLCVKVWELWNGGVCDTIKISEILNIHKTTVTRYLKKGNECKKCSYTVEKCRKVANKKNSGINNKNSKSIICITTKRIFTTLTMGAKYYNIKGTSDISRCCQGKHKSAGKYNGTKLVWRYLIVDHNKILRGKDIFKLHN